MTGPEFDSRACVARLKQAVLGRGASLSMLVEQQPEVPLDSALAPDGLPFNASGMLHWGAARHFGWRMNVRGMAQAARLRRSSRKTHVLSLRVRPEECFFKTPPPGLSGKQRAPFRQRRRQPSTIYAPFAYA